MKDSGVQWLGEVPAHWAVERLKHYVGWLTLLNRIDRTTCNGISI